MYKTFKEMMHDMSILILCDTKAYILLLVYNSVLVLIDFYPKNEKY